MSTITFGPAEERPKKVIAGIAGGTGSGKTFSALELGTGLVFEPSRHLFLIDTEFGRGAHYANAFAFQYGQLSPPFRPQRYIDAIDSAIKAGAECVIVDSLSHMWEGEAGLLDWHGDLALKMARGDEQRAESYNFPAWRLPKQELQKFVLYLQRCPVHLILCLRAKQKSKMVKGKDGRTEIVDAGLQPVIDTATPYEATFLAMLSQEEPGVPHWTHKALASYLQPMFANGPKTLSREHGKRLAEWCAGGGPDSHETHKHAAAARAPDTGSSSEESAGGGHAAIETHGRPAAARAPDLQTRQAKTIADELRAAPLVDRPAIWMRHWPVIEGLRPKLQRRLEEVRDEGTPAASGVQTPPPTDDGRTFDDDIKDLEPPEWREEEGRVEDKRQEELL